MERMRSIEDLLEMANKAIEEAESAQTELGLPEQRKPASITIAGQLFDGSLPSNMSDLSDKDLGNLLAYTAQMAAYCSAQEEMTKARRTILKDWLEIISTAIDKKKDAARLNATYQDILYRVHVLLYTEACASAAASQAAKNYSAVSRVVALREGTNDRANRDLSVRRPTNMPTFKGYGTP